MIPATGVRRTDVDPATPDADLPSPARDRTLLAAAAVILLLAWTPSLFWSFWVDEAITFWLAHDGPLAAFNRWQHWAGHSLIHAVISSFFILNSGPFREFVLRVPSIAGAAMAAWFVYKLAEDGIGKGAGLPAVVMFAFNPLTLALANQARPYALAWAALTGATWALHRWLYSGRRGYLAAYVIASAAMFELRMLFGVMFIVHAVYAAAVLHARRSWPWRGILAGVAALALLLMPLIPQMRMLLKESHGLSFSDAARPEDLFPAVVPAILIFGAFVATLAVYIFFPRAVTRPSQPATPFLILLFAWATVAPIVLLVPSVATSTHLFVPRYYSVIAPAQALWLGYVAYALFGPDRAVLWALIAVLASVGSPLGWATHQHGQDELKPFIDIIKSESSASVLPPVFFRSEQPESVIGDWRRGLDGDGYLYTPFVAYPVPNRILPLPFQLTPDAKAYVVQTIQSELAPLPEVIFVTHDSSWIPWMTEQMGAAGFTSELRQPNRFSVVIYRRATQ